MTIESRILNAHSAIPLESQSIEQKGLNALIEPKTIPYYDCCDSPTIIETRGTYVCKNCAVVHEATMKEGVFSEMDARHVKAIPLNNQGSRTTFAIEKVSAEKRLLFRRLSRLNNYYNDSVEANRVIANRFLLTVASQLELPKSIQNVAIRLYKKVLDARLTMGRSIKQLMVACLVLACNLKEYPCHISSFTQKSQIPEKSIRKNCRLILTTFKITPKRFSVSNYLEKYLTQLELPPKFQQAARKSLEIMENNGYNTTTNSRAFAVASIYAVSKNTFPTIQVKQKVLADISKVSEVTLRKYVKLFVENVNYETLLI